MAFADLLIHRVTVCNPTEDHDDVDRHGNPVLSYDWDSAEDDVHARVQQEDGEELTDDRDARITRFTVFLPVGTDITALARVRFDSVKAKWDGKITEVDGEPEILDAMSAPHHVEATTKTVEGG